MGIEWGDVYKKNPRYIKNAQEIITVGNGKYL